MRASQSKGPIFYKEDFNTLADNIKQLMTVLVRLGRSGLDFRPDVDTVMDGEIISSLNQQLEVLVNFVSKLLSDNSSPSFGQVSLRSPLARLFAFKTVLDDYYERLNKLVDPTRQMIVGSPHPDGKSLRVLLHEDDCEYYNEDVKQLSTGLYNYIIGDDVKTILQMGDAAFNRDRFKPLDPFDDSRDASSPVLAIPPSCIDSVCSQSPETDRSSPYSFFSNASSSPGAISPASSYEDLSSDTQFPLDL